MDNSAAYIASWLGRLREDAKLVVQAAGAAQKAADNIVATTALDQSMLWPQGSDNGANSNSRALPAIWADGSDIGDKGMAFGAAAQAMQAAAGTGLEGLQAAMGPLGEACVACHKGFRAPAN